MVNMTRREVQILQRLAQGKTYKEIASEFQTSLSTVKHQCSTMYEKMNALSNAHAVAIAKDTGVI